MEIFLKKAQLDYFRKKSLNSPNEQLAFLIGRQTAKGVEITRFVYPKLVDSTPVYVESDSDSDNKIRDEAAARGLRIVGSIHSHPNCPPVMSAFDYSGHLQDGDVVSGIVSVMNRKTQVCFWSAHSALPCEFTYI